MQSIAGESSGAEEGAASAQDGSISRISDRATATSPHFFAFFRFLIFFIRASEKSFLACV
jgi:hypothetical protein